MAGRREVVGGQHLAQVQGEVASGDLHLSAAGDDALLPGMRQVLHPACGQGGLQPGALLFPRDRLVRRQTEGRAGQGLVYQGQAQILQERLTGDSALGQISGEVFGLTRGLDVRFQL